MTSRFPDSPDDGRVPIQDVLKGLSIHPFDEGESPVEAFVVIKLLEAAGRPS